MPLSLLQAPRRPRRARPSRQRGMAALVSVLALLLLVTLSAGYSARNLIFEQRTGINQYRATQALEAADAGQDWALGLLNAGLIDGSCSATADLAQRAFRDRYLDIAPVGGRITPDVVGPVVNAQDASPTPACQYDPQEPGSASASWRCRCADDTALGLAAPGGDAVLPAFRVRLQRIREPGGLERDQPGIIRLETIACTRLDEGCLSFNTAPGALGVEGRAYTSTLVALAGNAANLPLAPLVARGTVSWPGLTAANGDVASGGIVVQSGGSVPLDLTDYTLLSLPGTPGETAWVPGMAIGNDELFASVFRTRPGTFAQQPAARTVGGCAGGNCSIQAVRDLLAANPGSPIRVPGNLVIDSAGDVGGCSPPGPPPALIVVEGEQGLIVATSGVTICGLVYLRAPPGVAGVVWAPNTGFTVRGAVVVDGRVDGTAPATLVYDAALLEWLRVSVGSFVRVPGSWRDTSQQ